MAEQQGFGLYRALFVLIAFGVNGGGAIGSSNPASKALEYLAFDGSKFLPDHR
jgi:hypothetical protein